VRAIDLFAGLGGFTEAARLAGLGVVWAANHDRLAVEMHRRNHPDVHHERQDLQQADWSKVPSFDVLLASPACQGHSRGASRGGDGRRGSAPAHDAMRSTAWAVVSCAEVHRPQLVIVENVPEFLEWVLYRSWRAALRDLGYKVAEVVLDAADLGVPQHRRRLFVTASRTGRAAIVDPPRQVERVPFVGCVDESADGWEPVAAKPPGVIERVRKGRRAFPTGMFLTQHVTGHPGRGLHRPIGTITTKAQWALVREGPHGDEARMITKVELRRAMAFHEGYALPETESASTRLLGNAVPPPMGRYVIESALRGLA
jgi:DNA (cytosine-5)-methyltransferase 1